MRVAAARMLYDVRAGTAEGRKSRGRRGRARARVECADDERAAEKSNRPSFPRKTDSLFDSRPSTRRAPISLTSPLPSSDASAEGAGFTRRRADRATRGPFALVKVLTRAPWVRAASAGTPTPRRKRRGCVIRVARRCYQRPRRELALTCNCARLKTRVQHVHLADEPRSHRLAARRAHRQTRFPRPNLPCPPDSSSTPTPALRRTHSVADRQIKSTHPERDRSDARSCEHGFQNAEKKRFPFSPDARS